MAEHTRCRLSHYMSSYDCSTFQHLEQTVAFPSNGRHACSRRCQLALNLTVRGTGTFICLPALSTTKWNVATTGYSSKWSNKSKRKRNNTNHGCLCPSHFFAGSCTLLLFPPAFSVWASSPAFGPCSLLGWSLYRTCTFVDCSWRLCSLRSSWSYVNAFVWGLHSRIHHQLNYCLVVC